MIDICLNGMNDVDEISPLRGAVSEGGEFVTTKIWQQCCQNASENIYTYEFQLIMTKPTALFIVVCGLF